MVVLLFRAYIIRKEITPKKDISSFSFKSRAPLRTEEFPSGLFARNCFACSR